MMMTMIYNYKTEKILNPLRLASSHTVSVTPKKDNNFRNDIVYLKLSLCILVKDKVSTPEIVVITAHGNKGYILVTGISMVFWIKRTLQEYRGVQAHSCIMGNQGKMEGNLKICIGIQSQLILPKFIYLMLPL